MHFSPYYTVYMWHVGCLFVSNMLTKAHCGLGSTLSFLYSPGVIPFFSLNNVIK